MKSAVLAFVSLMCLTLAPVRAAEQAYSSSKEKFYGKITAIDHGQKSVTVHNKKQDRDERFQWSEQTTVISDRKPIQPAELKVGQSLVVSYISENDLNKAQRITVRHPFKKSQSN